MTGLRKALLAILVLVGALVLLNIKTDEVTYEDNVEPVTIKAISIEELRKDGKPKILYGYEDILRDMSINKAYLTDTIIASEVKDKDYIKVSLERKAIKDNYVEPVLYLSVNLNDDGVIEKIDSVSGTYIESDADGMSGSFFVHKETDRSMYYGGHGELVENARSSFISQSVNEVGEGTQVIVTTDGKLNSFGLQFYFDTRLFIPENI